MDMNIGPRPLKDRPPHQENGEDKFLDIAELADGDVLLSSGGFEGKGGWITWLVRVLDAAGYSHSAFFDRGKVVEAGLKGVVTTDIATAVDRNRYTDVYHFLSDDGKRIGHSEWPYPPLADKAGTFIDLKYGTADAILAGVLVQTRKHLFATGDGLDVLIFAMWRAVRYLQDALSGTESDKALTCSELVYRIFYEAQPRRKYRITIDPTRDLNDDIRSMDVTDSFKDGSEYEIPVYLAIQPDFNNKSDVVDYRSQKSPEEVKLLELINEFSRLYERLKQGDSIEISTDDFEDGPAPSNKNDVAPVADYVTPGDICVSTNIVPRGRLRKVGAQQWH